MRSLNLFLVFMVGIIAISQLSFSGAINLSNLSWNRQPIREHNNKENAVKFDSSTSQNFMQEMEGENLFGEDDKDFEGEEDMLGETDGEDDNEDDDEDDDEDDYDESYLELQDSGKDESDEFKKGFEKLADWNNDSDFDLFFDKITSEMAHAITKEMGDKFKDKGVFLESGSESLSEAEFFNSMKNKVKELIAGPVKEAISMFMGRFLPHLESWVATGVKPPTVSREAYQKLIKPLFMTMFNMVETRLQSPVPDQIWEMSN